MQPGFLEENRIHKLFGTHPYKWLFEEVEEYTKGMLSSYIEDYKEGAIQPIEKEIYDAIWGSIPFTAEEVFIIDSPIIQRLRRIRQLGMSDFVYAGSLYSRFSHTIGVVSIANSMTQVVNSRIEKLERIHNIAPEDNKKEFFLCIVRLSAIFHDAGHFFYSHATEKFFRDDIRFLRRAEIDEILDKLREDFNVLDIGLHELISCMIVNTTTVKTLLSIYIDEYNKRKNRRNIPFSSEKCVEYISALIIGVPTDREILPYSKIINGPVDADKCDYLSRDSHMTKIPAGVDISRLIHKLSVIIKKEGINTSTVWNDSCDSDKKYFELAVSESAERTIFQLCMAKNTMYGSIYYHQKVLTAEATYREIIGHVFRLFPDDYNSFTKMLVLTDDFFGQYLLYYLERKRDALAAEKTCEEDDSAIDEQLSEINKLIFDINNLISRILGKRVADVSFDNLNGDQTDKIQLNGIMTLPEKADELSELIDKTVNEYCKVQSALGKEIKKQNVKLFVISQSPNEGDPSKVKVNIDLGNGQYRPFRKYGPIVSKEADDRKVYFVTNQFDRDMMYVALEIVLYRDYKSIMLKGASASCMKYRNNEIKNRKKALFDKQYYEKQLNQLIPGEFVVGLIDQGKKKIEDIAKKFGQFDGQQGKHITGEAVVSFLKQFCGIPAIKPEDYKTLLSTIVSLLEQAIFINRQEFRESMTPLLQCIVTNTKEDYYIYALGGPGDSASHLNYYMKNEVIRFFEDNGYKLTDVQDLGVWLESRSAEKDTLVFFDDGAYSGRQALSIFQTYFGVSEEKRATKDAAHVEELNLIQKEKLRNSKILIVYVCGAKQNFSELKRDLSKSPLNLNIIDIKAWHDISTPLIDSTNESGKIAGTALYYVGYHLLINNKPHWEDDRKKLDALGYNNSRQMVFTSWSVPTYTMTAFWMSGEIEANWKWKSLFERTTKD